MHHAIWMPPRPFLFLSFPFFSFLFLPCRLLQTFDTADYFLLVGFTPLVNDVENVQRGRHIAEPDSVLRVPLEYRAPKPEPAVKAFAPLIGAPIKLRASILHLTESRNATLGKSRIEQVHLALYRRRVQRQRQRQPWP